MLNGYSVNGAYLPTWVVRAAVVAAAAATVVTVAPQRILLASAYGDASVVITLTETQVVAARANGTAGVTSSSVTPAVIYSGAVNANAAASGYALVVRVVQASAGGDASATGSALPNAKLGEVLASSASTVVTCDAHRIRPGASLQPVVATADPISALVTRSPLAPLVLSATATGRSEASTKLNGESFYRHDGYVLNALASCTPTIDQEKTNLIASFGSFDYATGTGTSTAFVRHRAAASVTGVATIEQAAATRTAKATATGSAVATASVEGTRVRNGAVTASAAATRISITPAQRHAGTSTALTASANYALANGVRQARGSSYAESTAWQQEVFFARQEFGIAGGQAVAYAIVGGATVNGAANGTATATASATTATQHYALVDQDATAFSGLATTGNQFFADSLSVGVSGAFVSETFNPGARGFAQATAFARTAEFQRATVAASAAATSSAQTATQHFGNALGASTGSATASGTFNPAARGTAQASGSASAGYVFAAQTTGTIATATAFPVNARALSDEPADDGRQMALPGEDRGMVVPQDDRTMMVTT